MNHLGLFAKFWQPGAVKTRLAASIGESAACELYRTFVVHLLSRLNQTADQRFVVYAPASRGKEFSDSIPATWKLCPQVAGDLGTRMKTFISNQLDPPTTTGEPDRPPTEKVVVIGADCPQLDGQAIQSAFDLLDQAPVVIGPSTDGGYYLIAMRDSCIDVFADIQWSTDSVFENTISQLRARGVEYRTLPPQTDVDDINGLISLKSNLERINATQGLDELDQQLLSSVCLAASSSSLESNHDH